MFNSINELIQLSREKNKSIHEIMIEEEIKNTGKSHQEIYQCMTKSFEVMKNAINKGKEGIVTHSGLCGNDAKRLFDYLENNKNAGNRLMLKAACYAIATNEVNASMGIICATPTAGSCGVLPGALIAVQEEYGYSDTDVINQLFAAGAIGLVIANNASISGAAGGCQAEIGSASAMAAAAVCLLRGGSCEQAAHAMAMAMKNMLGLTCDPLGGLVEVPCIKRNASGAVNALLASDMALAGIESKVPWDEVIEAMHITGKSMPSTYRETSLGGLAITFTGLEWKKKTRG